MKTLSLRKCHHPARVTTVLIMVALIAGMVGCAPVQEYTLSVSSTPGGNVTHPGIGTFTYPAGAVVLLEAAPEEGYGFAHWSGNVSSVLDVNAATTTITMNGHYFITANFVQGRLIRNWYDLDDIRDNLDSYCILMNDLDSTTVGYEELASEVANQGKGWQPIGFGMDGFTGTFNGQGHRIGDLFINRPDEHEAGLFGFVDSGGVIRDLGVVNVTVTGGEILGGLVGLNDGTVSNSYSTGSVTGTGGLGSGSVGGLVGANFGSGTVSDSYFSGSVNGNCYIGGLVGANGFGIVRNSHYNHDEVLINGENIITTGALFNEDFQEWLANDRFLDVNERLSKESDYYVINNLSDFKELLAFGQNSSLRFRLKNDLDLATEPNFYIPYLAGEFDGNDHRILNLSFDFDFGLSVGLFGYLAPGGKITQLSVENVSIAAAVGVGALVGLNEGAVSNSYSSGNITGEWTVGGLVGGNGYGSTVSNSYSTGSVTADGYVGGLVGENGGTVSNSYSTGSVTGHGSVTANSSVGGLVGSNYVAVSNCYSTGNVTGTSFVGGLVGDNDGTVSNSYSTGNVIGIEDVGGLVGYNDATISNSYSTGSVTGNSSVGGLVGQNGYTVSNSFWDTETSGQATSDGGTGKNTTEMHGIATFSGAAWDIVAVADPSTRNPSYIWNIVDDETYPFLSWQP